MLWFLIVLSIIFLGFIWMFVCERFDFWDAEPFGYLISVIGSIVLVIMAIVAINANTDTDAYAASMQRRYEVLVYQLENNVYENDNDVGKRDLYEQVRNWNEYLAVRKELQDSVWVGMFYADIYDQFEFIPLR